MPYEWDGSKRRYYTENGRAVPQARVREYVQIATEKGRENLRALTEQFKDGKISLAAWQVELRSEIKTMHLGIAEIAFGGRQSMTTSEFGKIGAHLKRQYEFLGDFGRAVENGEQPLDGTLVSRSGLYADALQSTFENMYRFGMEREGEAAEELNVITSDNSCAGCEDASEAGWQPIGTLPDLGDRDCVANDKCYFEYR